MRSYRVGRGHSGVANKLSALLHALVIELSPSESIATFCDTFACSTTDMGTELAICDFEAEQCMSLMPPWMQRVSSLDVEPPDEQQTMANVSENALPKRKCRWTGGGQGSSLRAGRHANCVSFCRVHLCSISFPRGLNTSMVRPADHCPFSACL